MDSGPVEYTAEAFGAAAEARLADAATLAAAERFAGAVYLVGYVAEAELKAALWALLRLPSPAPWTSLAGRIESVRERDLPTRARGDGHDLRLLADVLRQCLLKRYKSAGKTSAMKQLAALVGKIDQSWSTDLRYTADPGDERTWSRVSGYVSDLRRCLAVLRRM